MLLLTACGERTPVAVDGALPPASAVGAACETDADCESEFCLTDPSFPDGYCTKDCSSVPICPAGATCHEYLSHKLCLDLCSGDNDCRSGYVCTYGVCRPPCKNSLACKKGDTCLNGYCKSKCTKDTDCPDKYRCQDGKCVAPCKSDTECLPGYRCNPTSGRCEPKQGKAMGEACAVSTQCATSYCLPGRKICSIKCTGSGQCPSDYVCGLEPFDKDNNSSLDDAVAACVPVKGKGAAGALCASDAACASSHCYYGICMEACATAADCTKTGATCASVNILLEGGIPTYKGCLPKAGNAAVYTLGTFPSSVSAYHGFDVPAHAGSFVINTEMSTLTDSPYVGQLKDPAGTVVMQIDSCYQYAQPNRYQRKEQISTLMVPNTTAVKIVPGVYTYLVVSTSQKPVKVTLQLKYGQAQKGTFNLNWFFLNLAGTCIPGPTLTASNANTHSWLSKQRNNLIAILAKAGLKVGTEKFYNLSNPALDVLDLNMTGISTDLQQLFASSNKISGRAINIFFVREIKATGMGGTVLGIAGGIPGPPAKHGTVHSGVAMSMKTACYESMGYNPAHTLAHEIGHYLGLPHNLENVTVPGFINNKVICPCPCGANLTCVSQAGNQWCRGTDHLPDTTTSSKNLMYFAAESTQMFIGNQLTPGQIRVMLNNPLVGF